MFGLSRRAVPGRWSSAGVLPAAPVGQVRAVGFPVLFRPPQMRHGADDSTPIVAPL